MKIVVATRKSALALAQCRAWLRQLTERHAGLEVEELHVTTSGDRIQDRSLSDIGGKGLFIKEIEEAILDGRADIAVHSMKDVPPALASGLTMGCVPLREDPRDVLVSRTGAGLADLPTSSVVGTSSLRRQAQLLAVRPDLRIVAVRGNVDTRLRKCRDGEVDAVILALAGLKRLGLEEHVTQALEPELSLPAVAQGALGIEHRSEDRRIMDLLAPMQHVETATAVSAERGVLEALGGDCKTPVGAFAMRVDGDMLLRGMLATADCLSLTRRERRVAWPASYAEAREAGIELGHALREALAT